jgi:heme/copper-type cytochrome/quinol oxidase subunit 2
VVLVAVVGLGWLAVTELLARVGGSSVTAFCPAPTKEAAMSTWLWVLIIVVVLVLVFGVMRRRGR